MKTSTKKTGKGTATVNAAIETSKKPSKETKPNKPETKPAKTETKPAMTRIAAMTVILKDKPSMEREEACKLADELYQQQTGKQSNPQEQLFCYRYAIQVFETLGLIKAI